MSLPTAVSDTSVLINLDHVGLLLALSHLYREVLVPAPVRVEFLRGESETSRKTALDLLTRTGFFSPCDDFDSVSVDLYHQWKMTGAEAEALSQLKMRNADVLLIDEKIGRRIAEREMRRVQGTVSILARLHRLGFTDYKNSIDRLMVEKKMRISEQAIRRAFENEVGENY